MTHVDSGASSGATIIGIVPVQLRHEFFSQDSLNALDARAQTLGGPVAWFEDASDFESAVGRGAVFSQAQVLISSWYAPRLEGDVLAALPVLSLLAHTGGTVRPFISSELFERKVAVTQAGSAMGRPVAEVALTFTLCLLHQVHRFTHGLQAGADFHSTGAWPQHEIGGTPIGVVGASRTGRHYISLVQALGGQVRVYDPYLSPAQAAELGVAKMDLEQLMATSQIVAVHAPTLPQTHHMINADMLALLPDGAGLVNTARSWLVDESALIAEAQTGRIDVAVDVFDEEPMGLEHPFRALPNVLLTPHRAAGTVEGRLRGGEIVVEEITKHLQHKPLEHQIFQADLERMA